MPKTTNKTRRPDQPTLSIQVVREAIEEHDEDRLHSTEDSPERRFLLHEFNRVAERVTTAALIALLPVLARHDDRVTSIVPQIPVELLIAAKTRRKGALCGGRR